MEILALLLVLGGLGLLVIVAICKAIIIVCGPPDDL